MTKDEALKLALEALESLYNDSELMVTHRQHKGMKNAITAIREALAQPDVDRRSTESKETFDQQEPVAYLDEGLGAFYWAKDYKKHVGFKPLYTTPPQRKPLTDEEIQKCYETTGHCQTLRPQDRFAVFAFARAIEAAHGIKGKA